MNLARVALTVLAAMIARQDTGTRQALKTFASRRPHVAMARTGNQIPTHVVRVRLRTARLVIPQTLLSAQSAKIPSCSTVPSPQLLALMLNAQRELSGMKVTNCAEHAPRDALSVKT